MSKPNFWNGPGELKTPIVMATAKSVKPKMFHQNAERRPLALPDAPRAQPAAP